MKHSTVRIDEKLEGFLTKLNDLDFGPLAYKLMNPEDRLGLSFEQTVDAIEKYKGFLFLCQASQGKSISPSRYIDYVWHTHILDTELYLVQSAILFGQYLHHFPFFGKRGGGDEKELLAAAEFTKHQAASYFDWDDDDWCGTGPKPKGPRPHTRIEELADVLLPGGAASAGLASNPDVITIQAGNFRHTVEHFGAPMDSLFAWRPSRFVALERFLKLPVWVTVCMPADIGIMNGVAVIQQKEKLTEISKSLVDKRLSATGFNRELARLQVRA